MEEITTREEAKAKGLKHYFTGKPCKHGHVSRRFTSNGICTSCNLESHMRFATKNPDKIKAIKATHYAANKDKIKAKDAAYYAANKDKIKERVVAYRAANPDKIKAKDAAYYAKNSDKIKARWAEKIRELKDNYVALRIGLPVKQIPVELLELKRQQLEIHRLNAELNRELKEIRK